MGCMIVGLAVLSVAAGAPTWGHESKIGQRFDVAGGRLDHIVKRIASAQATSSAATMVTEANETTFSTGPAAPTALSSEEEQTQPSVPAPQSQLNLEVLEERIRETDALGFFTKLSLKNKVDDLLDWFRAYHRGKSALTIEQLYERYNLLLLKLTRLLADDDAQLSRDILSSRRAIWTMLADPEQFATLE